VALRCNSNKEKKNITELRKAAEDITHPSNVYAHAEEVGIMHTYLIFSFAMGEKMKIDGHKVRTLDEFSDTAKARNNLREYLRDLEKKYAK